MNYIKRTVKIVVRDDILILKVNEYIYKKRIHRTSGCQGN